MSNYTPTTEMVQNTYANERVDEEDREGNGDEYDIFTALDEFDRWVAEVERAAAEKALGSFAEHLLTSTMPEYGPGINVTPYRDGLIDGVNRAVIAASRFYRSEGV